MEFNFKRNINKKEVINLTKNSINLQDSMSNIIYLESKGHVKIKLNQEVVGVVNGIPVWENVFEKIEGLPEPEEGKVYIVEGIVLEALNGTRKDVYVVNTNRIVGNLKDNIVTYQGLKQ